MLALCCSRLVANSCPSTWAPAIVSVPSAGSLCSALQQHERVVSGQAQQASSSQQPTRNDQKPSCSQEHAACSWNSERCISQSNSADLSIRNNLACTTQVGCNAHLATCSITCISRHVRSRVPCLTIGAWPSDMHRLHGVLGMPHAVSLNIGLNLTPLQGAWGTPLQQPPLTQQPFQGWGLRQVCTPAVLHACMAWPGTSP